MANNSPSFFFYDLETSGFSPRADRPLQFAGQRTGMDLEPIGGGVSRYLALTPDILPEPGAVIVNRITPQISLQKGMTESDFLAYFNKEIATPGTIFVGYNSVRFDDEFVRFMLWRNYYDAYQWQWKDDRSRWDLLDVVRMTRALRPANISWPFDSKGQPSNKLELLASVNKIEHLQAHEALSDVRALIALARLIKSNQPKLFEYLLKMRDKKAVEKLVRSRRPFLYTSGKFASEHEKTTVAYSLGPHPSHQGDLVYDLRYDPTPYAGLEPAELAELWHWVPDVKTRRLPVKTLQFNRCPAVAPLSVLDPNSRARLKLDLADIDSNLAKLKAVPDWPGKLHQALELMDKQRQAELIAPVEDVDARLYDGFIGPADERKMVQLRSTPPAKLHTNQALFKDQRLNALLPLYKARNFPDSLTAEEQSVWQAYLVSRLISGGKTGRLQAFQQKIKDIEAEAGLSTNQKNILHDLRDYGLRIASVVDAG